MKYIIIILLLFSSLASFGQGIPRSTQAFPKDSFAILRDPNGTFNGVHGVVLGRWRMDTAVVMFHDTTGWHPVFPGTYNSITGSDFEIWDGSKWNTISGGGATAPAGNYGNLQINRNNTFSTPASDSLTFSSGILFTTGGIITHGFTTYNSAETKSINLNADNPSIDMNGIGTTLHLHIANITGVKDLEFPNVSGNLAESVTINGITTHANTAGNINIGSVSNTDNWDSVLVRQGSNPLINNYSINAGNHYLIIDSLNFTQIIGRDAVNAGVFSFMTVNPNGSSFNAIDNNNASSMAVSADSITVESNDFVTPFRRTTQSIAPNYIRFSRDSANGGSVPLNTKIIYERPDTMLTTPDFMYVSDNDTIKKYPFSGGGSSLFPTTGTGTATGDVTGDLDGHVLQVMDGGRSLLQISSNNSFIQSNDGIGHAGTAVFSNVSDGYVFDFEAYDGFDGIDIYGNAAANSITYTAGTNIISDNLTLSTFGSGTHTGTATYGLSVDASGNVIETTGGGVSGSGTNRYIPMWTPNGTTLGNSGMSDAGDTLINITNERLVNNSSIASGTDSAYWKWFTLSGLGVPNRTVGGFGVYRQINGALDLHAFEDWTILNQTGFNLGYASYDATPVAIGSSPADHLTAFQARPIWASSGNITNWMASFDAYSPKNTGSGTIPNYYGLRLNNITNTGGGSITNNYGVYIDNITGGTNNRAIYVGGGLSEFNGDIVINASGSFSSQSDGTYFSANRRSISMFASASSGAAIATIGTGTFSGSVLPITFISYNGSTLSTMLSIAPAGGLTVTSLAGTGSRAVLADAAGLLFAPVSDRNAKMNIHSFSNGLNMVMSTNPVNFFYKPAYQHFGTTKQIGFIAQDIQKILPNSVYTNSNDGTKGYNELDLIPVLWSAIQEQQKEIEELKTQIKQLKNR